MKKNALLELYRFIAAITILLLHVWQDVTTVPGIWFYKNNWRLGVEFFFALSGFLLYLHCRRKKNESSVAYLLGKVRFFFPYVLVMFLLNGLREVIINQYNFFDYMLPRSHYLLFYTNETYRVATGIPGMGVLWYVCALLAASFVIHYMLNHHEKLWRELLAVVMVVVGYTVVIRLNKNLTTPEDWNIGGVKIFVPTRFFRAMAGISLGTLLGMAYEKASAVKYTNSGKICGTIASMVMFTGAVVFSFLPTDKAFSSGSWKVLWVVLMYGMAILLAAVFAGDFPKGKKTRGLLCFLGKYSLHIYLTHTCIIYLMWYFYDRTIWKKEFMLMTVAGTAVLCVVLELAVRGIRKGTGAVCGFLRNKCIVKE
ncbi:MAG: acyltransferase family protein [Clostridia bacterium]|nr:acyltransferase family protein [Clostridia bacterium]